MANPMLEDLDALVGEWETEARLRPEFGGTARGRTTFEWLGDRAFLVQRSEAERPEFPRVIALIGAEGSDGALVQHYFDSRGVARRYETSLVGGVWGLSRKAQPPDFSQRFTGELGDDGRTISGRWEICHDGSTWEHDFDVVYKRVT